MSFAWSVLYDMSLCLFCFAFWVLNPCWTHLFERYHDLLELLSVLHLNLLWARTCSSASVISFWAWCSLLFLKKCSLSSLRFIRELVKFSRNSLLLHLNYFKKKKQIMLMIFTYISLSLWKATHENLSQSDSIQEWYNKNFHEDNWTNKLHS